MGVAPSMETQEERVRRVAREHIDLVPYSPAWQEIFRKEKEHLRSCLPRELIRRIEHFGSTSVPGLMSKPIVDVLVEVTSLEATTTRIVPLLEAQGYEFFWRPSVGDSPPLYAWFIKRNAQGQRTHHIHMVERQFPQWDTLLFRDYLIDHPDVARDYQALKQRLAAAFPGDRESYTKGKTEFIVKVTEAAKRLYAARRDSP
jgi:GrpB-like predicted nucleotidyltransferase (UPF0157 family)